ncbi:MAG TPA: BLUF domain-containing protein [Friedmanniella sp.]
MIFTTAYTSEMVRPMSDPELVDLLVESRARNADRGITGLLLYRSGRVLQMLEGDEDVVRTLYDRIRMDVRHQHVTNVWTSNAVERRFPSWTMGFEELGQHEPSFPAAGRIEDRHERDAFAPSSVDDSAGTLEQQDYLGRRRTALRRALVSGDRLVGALGIILNGHEPEVVEGADQTSSVRCRACRSQGASVLDAYPCPTAKNALWALEGSGSR